MHSRPSVSAQSATARSVGRWSVASIDGVSTATRAVAERRAGAAARRRRRGGCRRPPRRRWPRRAARRRWPPRAARSRSPPSPRWWGRRARRAGRRRAGRRGRWARSSSRVGVARRRRPPAAWRSRPRSSPCSAWTSPWCQKSARLPTSTPMMPGAAAAQRAGDGIGGVAQLGGGLLHPRLRLGGGLHPAQRVADRRGREAGVLRELADGGALARRAARRLRRCAGPAGRSKPARERIGGMSAD